MDLPSLVSHLFAGGTAFAGLVLVFLGGVITAYESYDPTQKSAVRKKYQARAWVAFTGFVTALLSAVAALLASWTEQTAWAHGGVAALAASFVLVLVLALLATTDVA
jgi:hypothetical protein